MGWEHAHYLAVCKSCGREGEKISSSDDWGRHEVSWVGFKTDADFPRHSYLVARKRIDPYEFAVCECGSTDIEVGQLIRHT
jgi:hypothetical protein